MTKILMLALGVLASVSTCPASAADNKYDYDRTHHNGSYNDRSTSPSPKSVGNGYLSDADGNQPNAGHAEQGELHVRPNPHGLQRS